MTQDVGSYALISVEVVTGNNGNELAVNYTSIAFMLEATKPVISIYPGVQDIVLPKNSNRPFAFVCRYETGGLGSGYGWNSNPLMSVAICPAGTEPVFGQPLPNGFSGPYNNGGGEICFINANNTKDKRQYQYRLALYPTSGLGQPATLDPKITNGGTGINP